ncbi:glycosyltransferase [Microlunatus elymi]|uniref:Glycosyltransferase n=1 Tax=Microlunatus elymi TaxID=2596828 RepID=A0A516PUE1_9ACTN|nr:glycosyltransferase [Microlunatus elymi]QDP94814.1 glycosyltransferase [Microlunatus elymi]
MVSGVRIGIIGKVPPIEGGVSRSTFWEALATAEIGYATTVVTNASEVEQEYRSSHLGQMPTNPLLSIHSTVTPAAALRHIPRSNPFVSKLVGLALTQFERSRPEFIHAHYLEPYGVAAMVVSKLLEIPYGVRHAGSDVGRLYNRAPELRGVYERVFADASYIIASARVKRALIHLGIDPDAFLNSPPDCLNDNYFRPSGQTLDFSARRAGLDPGSIHARLNADSRFDESAPTLGVYGKVGEFKGSFDLVEGLRRMRSARYNLVVLSSGPPVALEQMHARATELGVAGNITWIPFIPHWEIPQFIRGCTAVAFLERNFPIAIHRPGIMREVMACGRPLVVSQEVAAKAPVEGEPYLVVDPTQPEELAAALDTALEPSGDAAQRAEAALVHYAASAPSWVEYREILQTHWDLRLEAVRERKQKVSAIAVQKLVARLSVSEPFREWFKVAPAEAMRGYDLSDDETEVLRKINRRMLDHFAASLMSKWRQSAEHQLPRAHGFLEDDFSKLFSEYYGLHAPDPSRSRVDYILAFARFLEDSFSIPNADDRTLRAMNICKLDRCLLEVKTRVSSLDSLLRINAKTGGLSPDSKVARDPRMMIESFDYPVTSLIDPASFDGAQLDSGMKVAFRPADSLNRSPCVEISGAVGRLLGYASESPRTIAEIAELYARDNGGSVDAEQVAKACQMCVDQALMVVIE